MNKHKSTNKYTQKGKEDVVKQVQKNSNFVWRSLFAIVVLGLLIYSNSYDCGFQLDDKHTIINNEVIKNISNTNGMWDLDHRRFLAYYSFAVNYHYGELNVYGYHFVNLIIHLLNSSLVFFITLLLFKSPVLKNNAVASHASAIALITGLLFVSHPLATGSVTYIVQRMASMVALFYFLSVVLYMKARLSDTKIKYWFFAGSLLAFISAIHTKENAYTLPFALFLIELYFFSTKKIILNFKDYRILVFLGGLVVLISIILSNFSFSVFNPKLPSEFNTVTITTSNYFFTQLSVIVKYIQLLFLPVNQNLDYDFPIANSLFEIPTLINGLILLSLVILALFLYNRNKIFSFGILWFFLTLSIESSIIPISDVIFEHRTYIPSFGFFIIISSGIYLFLWDKYKTIAILVPMLLIVSNAALTYQRNKVWKNEITMWSDVILKSPNKARGYLNLGYAYGNEKQWDKAILNFNKVNQISPKKHAAAYYNLGIAYWTIEQKELAMDNYTTAIKVDSNYADAYYGRGVGYYYLNEYDKALADYSKAISIKPRPELYFNRGMIFANKQKWKEAISDFSKAIETTKNKPDLYYNRAIVYGNNNEWDKAVADLTMTLQLNPQYKSAYSQREYAYSKLKTSGSK